MDANPRLLIVKAWTLSICGMQQEATAAIAAAEPLDGMSTGPMPDGASSVAASIATLRATVSFGDTGSAHTNAIRAAELESAGAPNWPRVCWSRGLGHFFRGEPVQAEPWFVEAAGLGPSFGMWIATASALAYQSCIAGDEGDFERQGRYAEQATRITRENGLDENFFTGEVPLALASWYAARGAHVEAKPLFERSIATFRSYGQPVGLAHALIRHARVLGALGEHQAAASAIGEARAVVDSCPDPGVLDTWVTALEAPHRSRSRQGERGLSERELTVLRALTGPLSERDIARELYLSHNTVHSHARSIYRKLGVTSRAEAVSQARELGLL
jgi:LuxR family transcriptional regulator, maltose regulon positive regulatory protein